MHKSEFCLATEISRTHPSSARRRTDENMCPLYANAWKTTSCTSAFLLPLLQTTLIRARENNIEPAHIASLPKIAEDGEKLCAPAPQPNDDDANNRKFLD